MGDLEVELEAGLDGVSVSEILPDGTYIPDPGARAALTSGIVAKGVHRAVESSDAAAGLSAASGQGGDGEGGRDDAETLRKWCNRILESLDATRYETARVMDLIAALRAADPVFYARRCAGGTNVGDGLSSGAMLKSKQKVLRKSAASLKTRADALRQWSAQENAFIQSVLKVRRECGGLTRDSKRGTPFVDCGGKKVPIRREGHEVFERMADVDITFSIEGIGEQPPTDSEKLKCSASKRFGSMREEVETGALAGEDRLVRAVRSARRGIFRSFQFAHLVQEATSSPLTIELGTKLIAVECGPSHTLRINATKAAESSPRTTTTANDVGGGGGAAMDIDPRGGKRPRSVQLRTLGAELVRITAAETALKNPKDGDVMERVIRLTSLRESLQSFEEAIDAVTKRLGLRAVWSRSNVNLSYYQVRVFAAVQENEPVGSLPSLIATLEACQDSGRVLVTPAFGAIVPSSDVLRIGGEDVPGSFYTFASEREFTTILCPLLCIRVLEDLELCARTNESSVLDVDRHGFSLTVESNRTGRTLRAKVWPGGEPERPVVTARLDAVPVNVPSVAPERLLKWKELLRTIVKQSRT